MDPKVEVRLDLPGFGWMKVFNRELAGIAGICSKEWPEAFQRRCFPSVTVRWR